MSENQDSAPCGACGGPVDDDGNWPSGDDRPDICFACWEVEADRDWWAELARIEKAKVALTYRTFVTIARRGAIRMNLWRLTRAA